MATLSKTILTFEPGVMINTPIQVTSETTQIQVGKGAHVDFELLNYQGSLLVEVGDNARCTLLSNTHCGPQTHHAETIRIITHTHSHFQGFWFSEGGAETQRTLTVDVQGEHALIKLNGLAILNTTQTHTTHTFMNHHVPNCETHQFFKHIVANEAQCEFNGLVYVNEIAQKTDSYQANHNLVLSDNARAISRPQLKIFADDVKCSHGATVGQLDEEQLFYLKTRGLPLAQARSILISGFAEEIIDRIPLEGLRKNIFLQLKKQLETL